MHLNCLVHLLLHPHCISIHGMLEASVRQPLVTPLSILFHSHFAGSRRSCVQKYLLFERPGAWPLGKFRSLDGISGYCTMILRKTIAFLTVLKEVKHYMTVLLDYLHFIYSVSGIVLGIGGGDHAPSPLTFGQWNGDTLIEQSCNALLLLKLLETNCFL